jgi:hypothetical protein
MSKFYWLWMVLAALPVYAEQAASPARLDQVAEKGRHVMPFHLEKTQHVFNKSEFGGFQQVIVKDAKDSEQIVLIRQHLREIEGKFVQGDFSGPRRIHGEDMPGLKELSANAKRIQFAYQDLSNGGQIEYRTADPQLIAAIHRYFDAQLSDHARHAVPGGHHRHHAQPQQ